MRHIFWIFMVLYHLAHEDTPHMSSFDHFIILSSCCPMIWSPPCTWGHTSPWSRPPSPSPRSAWQRPGRHHDHHQDNHFVTMTITRLIMNIIYVIMTIIYVILIRTFSRASSGQSVNQSIVHELIRLKIRMFLFFYLSRTKMAWDQSQSIYLSQIMWSDCNKK